MGDKVSQVYMPAVVQITTTFPNSGKSPEYGFGFVVGEKSGKLYIVTAEHVVRSSGPETLKSKVKVRFYHDQGKTILAELLDVVPVDGSDLALLRILKPVGFTWAYEYPYCSRYDRGDQVWFIGRQRSWFVPLDVQAGYLSSGQPEKDNEIELVISSVKPGTSGAPLISRQGIIGIITDDKSEEALAIPVRLIREFVKQYRYPWNLPECSGTIQDPEKSLKPGTVNTDKSKVGSDGPEMVVIPAGQVPEKSLKPGTVFSDKLKDGSDGPEMVVIPAGSFTMGSPSSETERENDEGPQHDVTFSKPFALGRFEVKRGDFHRFVKATKYKTEAERGDGCYYYNNAWMTDKNINWQQPGFEQNDRHPVVCVSWNDTKAYIDWLINQTGKSYRLPTEAEWEYAARAGTYTARNWGDDSRLKQACHYTNVRDETAQRKFNWSLYSLFSCADKSVYTAPAGEYLKNRFKVNDMLGNVWEWVEDRWHDDYQGAPKNGSAWTTGEGIWRVIRGGSWNSVPWLVRSAGRFRVPLVYRGSDLGFRLAQDL